jgi:hypothetical protein
MRAGQSRESHDGVAMHADESFGLTDSDTFDQVFQDRDRLLLGQAGVKQRGALPLREPGLAHLAVKETNLLVFSIPIADREIAGIASTVERTSRILTAEVREVVHGYESSWGVADRRIMGRKSQDKTEGSRWIAGWWPDWASESLQSVLAVALATDLSRTAAGNRGIDRW